MASSASSQSVPSPELRQSQFEQGVAIALHLWPALTIAVQNGWGGPDGADKRDWLAGVVVDMFPSLASVTSSISSTTPTSNPSSSSSKTTTTTTKPPPPPPKATTAATAADPPAEDVEYTLLQVLADEFEAVLDDGSEVAVAARVLTCRAACAAGDFAPVEDLRRRWLAASGSGRAAVNAVERAAEDQDTDWESDDDDDSDGDDSDVEMGGGGATVREEAAPRKEKAPPEVDEDGFTKVTRKKR
ncbi:Pre-rRNA-processing protein TSR2-domain-containing protein [Xylariaceae sp. FL0804]|nr:Pre-rRNA-processing protein TSR2-domain-containing protein [Xylariaceae sp. FL0804]